MHKTSARVSVSCILAAALSASAPQAPGQVNASALWPDHRTVLLIEATNGPALQFNALTHVDLPPDIASDMGTAGSIRVVELDDNGRPTARMPIQIDRVNGQDRIWLPLSGVTRPGQKRRFLVFAGGPKEVPGDQDEAAPKIRSFDALRVEPTDEQIRVGNEFLHAAHSARGGGGFPDAVTFAHSGLTTKQFYFHDRIYDAKTKALYDLKSDAASAAKIVASGPLRAVVEVQANYSRGDAHTKGNARATYRYEYHAASPIIAVSADVRQDTPETWTELHFLQLSTRSMSFPIWRAGENLAGRFVGSKKIQTVRRWGVMTDGTDAIGLLGTRDLIWHDDPHGYCAYYQFPVVNWSTNSHRFSGWIYIGPVQPHAIMEQWSQRLAHPPKLTIQALPALSALRAKISQLAKVRGETVEARYGRALYLRLPARDPTTVTQADLDAAAEMAHRFADRQPAPKRQRITAGERPCAVACQDGPSLWFANDETVFHFDLSTGGGITQLLNLAEGVDFIGLGAKAAAPLWRLNVRRKDGKMITVDSYAAGAPQARDFQALGTNPPGGDHVVGKLIWPSVSVPDCKGTLAVTAELFLLANDPLLSARLTVKNGLTDAGLWSVEFPVIAPLGERGRIDVAVPRGNWGLLHSAFAGGLGGHYPSGYWPMQYLSVTDGPCTLYLAHHHPRCGQKNLSLQAGGEFKFQHDPPDMGKPGADFVMDSSIVFGPIVGDWFDAARVYRDWAQKQIWMSKGLLDKRDDMPKRLRDGLVWLLLSGPPGDVVPKAIAAQEFLDVPIGIHWYNWHKIPFDDDYPHYFPTKDGVPEAVKKLTDRGIYVMPYINGRLWDSDTDDFKTVALPACTKDVHGKPYIETYGSGQKLVPMCPTTKVWQDKVCEIIDGLVNKVGVNAVYLDQIAAAGPRQCMDASHGHPLGGGSWWAPAYWKMMDRVQTIGARKSPDVFFTTENNAESYSQNIDAFLIWNPRQPNMIPINAVVYGGMRVHFANRVHPDDGDLAFAMKVGRDFLWGTQLGWMAPFYMEPAHKSKGVYFRRLAKARLMANKFLAYGQMLRPAEILSSEQVTAEWFGEGKVEHTVTWPAVAGACWRAPDGHVGLIFTNYDGQPHQFDFRPSEEAIRLMGKHPAWCLLMPDGLHRSNLRGMTQTGHYRSVVEARDVLVFEVIPCASEAEQKGRLDALPALVEKPRGPLRPPSSQRPLWAELKFSPGPTPAGEPIPGKLLIDGKRPDGNDWRVRLSLPSGYAVEPASLFTTHPKAWGPRSIDVLIYTPTDAGDLPIEVELIRGIGRQSLQLAPPRK